jgi:hypothetical protein
MGCCAQEGDQFSIDQMGDFLLDPMTTMGN